MKLLQQFIADLDHPVFIITPSSEVIHYANKAASKKSGNSALEGAKLNQFLNRYPFSVNQKNYGQFGLDWYEVIDREMHDNGQPLKVVELIPRKEVPFSGFFDSWKDMVEVMLHRLRSPMTGITGYLELIEARNKQDNLEKPLSAIQKGFDYIFDIMDELEALYRLSSLFDDERFAEVPLSKILNEQITRFSKEDQQRFSINEKDADVTVQTDAAILNKLLFLLLENAIHHSNNEIEIDISAGSPVTINISNKAPDLDPDIIERAFFPFVTSRADNLGIGSTIALVYAKQLGGTLFFEVKDGKAHMTLVFPFS